jgi:murein L,D-transpeptidase YcbB/YkuD
MNSKDSKYKLFAAGTAMAVVIAAALAVTLAIKPERNDAPHHAQVAKQEQAPALSLAETINPSALRSLILARISQEPESLRAPLTTVYERFSYDPLWSEGSRAKKRGKALETVVGFAEAQAISADALLAKLQSVKARALTPEQAAQADIALTIEAINLAAAFRSGAVARKDLGQSWVMRAETVDPLPDFIAALDSGDISGFYEALPPTNPQYKALTAALQRYRALAAQGGWPTIPEGKEILLDQEDARIAVLATRLRAEGYLSTASTDPTHLDAAIRQFQTRNGLEPDGRIGRGTLAALNISAGTRVAQIAANLERWRHTPRDLGADFIAVNSAATHLDVMRDGKSTLRLRVVAGDKGHATPILSATVTGVTFNPRWEIPASIARKEILPKLKKNPNYLAENNMVVVDGYEGDPSGQYHDWSQYSAQSFPLRLRQRAGSDNSLGLIKLQMTNPYNIYLHDTPAKKYFARDERHLSHGCIRVERPEELAENVLSNTPAWDAETINAAISTGRTQTAALKTPMPVYIFYWTVFAEGGALNFRNDVYNRDKPLAEKLGIKPVEQDQVLASNE